MTTGTYNFVSIILNTASVGLLTAAITGSASVLSSFAALLIITKFSDQVKTRFISELINGMFSVF